MNRLFSLVAMLCLSLLLSCTSDIEMPPPPEYPSSSAQSSSSNFVQSSSSISPSSSSVAQSSSSIAQSSSSAILSSSSTMPSSSSFSSSSNLICTASNNTETHYCSNGTMKEYGFMTDGVQTYKTVAIDTKTWMAENLDYNVPNSKCVGDNTGGDSQGNCAKYGRLYNWTTAKTVCPSGWHLPSDTEWTMLTDFVGGLSIAGTKLKSISGWNDYEGNSGNGTEVLRFFCSAGRRRK